MEDGTIVEKIKIVYSLDEPVDASAADGQQQSNMNFGGFVMNNGGSFTSINSDGTTMINGQTFVITSNKTPEAFMLGSGSQVVARCKTGFFNNVPYVVKNGRLEPMEQKQQPAANIPLQRKPVTLKLVGSNNDMAFTVQGDIVFEGCYGTVEFVNVVHRGSIIMPERDYVSEHVGASHVFSSEETEEARKQFIAKARELEEEQQRLTKQRTEMDECLKAYQTSVIKCPICRETCTSCIKLF